MPKRLRKLVFNDKIICKEGGVFMLASLGDIMIHSMAGGRLGKLQSADFVKVRFLEGPNSGDVAFYMCDISVGVGDIVVVPYGASSETIRAEVLRMDKNVLSDRSPIPFARAKKVLSKINNKE